MTVDEILMSITPGRPVIIAGPTASGKSTLALRIAERLGGTIVNADAMQVFDAWPLLTAQPTARERARIPHHGYGHVPVDGRYSAGDWLRDLAPLLDGPERPIIVGGTGLYLSALTEGLVEIPAVPPAVRAAADDLTLAELIGGLDDASRARIDLNNRARVQRAWEVLRATGVPLARWHAATPAPALRAAAATAICLEAPPDWLTPRIARRFDAMLSNGLVAEARAMRPAWNPAHQSAKAIGAAELIANLDGELSLDEVRDRTIVATRQYAKRQRTWFRKRMTGWIRVEAGTH